jgi:outer membrane receptor protein involved in Fe transport
MNYRISLLSAVAAAAFAFTSLPAQAQQPPATDQQQQKKAPKQKKPTTRQEVDKSVDSGTVPAKYRSSVPKQYQQYVPFAPSGR